MALYAFMVVRNEVGKFLPDVLRHTMQIADHVLVHDDCSDDNTAMVAGICGATVTVRKTGQQPSFMEHEGQFRTNALRSFDDVLVDGDWIMVVDADEYYVPLEGGPRFVRAALKQLTKQADEAGKLGVPIPIHTVWDVEKVVQESHSLCMKGPLLRTESTGKFTWLMEEEPRLWRYRHNVGFQDLPMACRNAPADVYSSLLYAQHPISILHYGLARPGWRQAKFERYRGLPGHNPDWVKSFLDQHPPLVPWKGVDPTPRLRRLRR